ncbi:MAG: hypothetical protein O6946_07990 [Gammaproteobacteria bacterium]|nr:hypothetical protein [Gammaproteobacteria bacterium]
MSVPLKENADGPGDDPQLRDVCEPVQQLLGDSVAKKLLFRVRTHVDERQNRNGLVAI